MFEAARLMKGGVTHIKDLNLSEIKRSEPNALKRIAPG